jgi:hypothetical protein
MASNTQYSQEHNNNNYELCFDSNNISKKGEFKMPNIDIENYVEEDRWDYSNECNEWEGGGLRNNYKPKQNRMLDNYVCNDRIRNDEVANILLSLNRKNTLTIHVMTKRITMVRETTRKTQITNLMLT